MPEERTQSLEGAGHGLGEVPGGRAHFGSGARVGFLDEVTLE